jgi:phenylacetate-CoA ligase
MVRGKILAPILDMNLNFLFPKARRDFAAAQECWRGMQARGDSDLSNLQLSKIQEVWRDAVRDVPYYGRLVKEGRAPSEIESWEDFFKIPELTREILQDHKEEFVRRSGPPDLWRMTGGSTGNPVKFGVWNSEDAIIRMLKLVLWHRVGYSPSDRLFLIWGHSHLLGTGWRRYWNHFIRKAKDMALGYKRVDAYSLSPELCNKYAEELMRYRPAGLIGYSAVLDYFIRSLPEKWKDFKALGLKFVMPCAEPAPREDSFELLGEVFGCPVIQEFGGVDFGHVGMKLGTEPFQVFSEYNFLETVEQTVSDVEERLGNFKDANDSLPKLSDHGGAALVTSLYRRYLPLIRYRQGDILGGVHKSVKGHVISFETLHGRINDMVSLEDGTSVHSVAVFHCAHQEPSVLNIQMILEDQGTRILLVTRNGYNSKVESLIMHRMRQISPLLGKAKIEAVEDLVTTRAGKRRWFVDLRKKGEA